MATITLYKEKVNGVGGLIDNLIKSSSNLDVQLGTLKNTLQGVDSSTCNLQDTVDSISSSSKSEKSKIEDLKKLNNKLSEFIETASRKDSAAEEEIKKSKEDFYTKYSYLKPECEKSVIEHICDGVQSAAEWCKEHWKLIVTIAIVIVSVAVLLIPGVVTNYCRSLLGCYFRCLYRRRIRRVGKCCQRRFVPRRFRRWSTLRRNKRCNRRSGFCRTWTVRCSCRQGN